MQTRQDIIEQFVRLRHLRGFTQERLEQLAGVSQQQISLIERGLANPRIDTLLALADILRVRIVLVSDEDVESRRDPADALADEALFSRVTGVDELIVTDED